MRKLAINATAMNNVNLTALSKNMIRKFWLSYVPVHDPYQDQRQRESRNSKDVYLDRWERRSDLGSNDVDLRCHQTSA